MTGTMLERQRTNRANDDQQAETFAATLREDVAFALAGASKLFDASAARPIAAELQSTFAEIASLNLELAETRAKLEKATHEKVEPRRDSWNAYKSDFDQRATGALAKVKRLIPELRSALEAEAVPASDDPHRALLARQDVEAVLGVHGTSVQPLVDIAARGGPVAAELVSEWGRLTYTAAGGDEEGFAAIRNAAVRSSLTGAQEGPMRAAAVLEAMDSPRPGDKGRSINTAEVYAGALVSSARKAPGPILD